MPFLDALNKSILIKFAFPNKNPIMTTEQLKDLKERVAALRRYL